MKKTPNDKQIIQRMTEGEWSLKGFLGDDPLGLDRIDADAGLLNDFDYNLEKMGTLLDKLWKKARLYFEDDYIINELKVTVYETKGKIPCPFGHPGIFQKGEMKVSFKNKTYRFSPLSIHMIKQHGFFGGLKSSFRVEPEELVELSKMIDL